MCSKRQYIDFFFFSSRRRHTRYIGDWSSDVCSSDLHLGPTLIEMFTYRVEGHSTSDDPSAYRPKSAGEHWPLGDPIARLRMHLSGLDEWDDARHTALQEELEGEVRAAQREAEKSGTLATSSIDFPQSVTTMFEDVFEEMPWHLREQQAQMVAELEAK